MGLCRPHTFRDLLQHIFDTDKIAARIVAEVYAVRHLATEPECVLPEGGDLCRHGKASVMTDLHRIGAFHVGHRVDERGTGVFFIRKHIAANLHPNKALIGERMLRKGFQVSFKAADIPLVFLDLLRIVFQNLIFQPELFALMIGFQELKPGHIHVQIHALFYARITGTEGLDLRKGKRGFVYILTGTYRGFAGHDLRNEALLCLQRLPEISIECSLRHIAADVYSLILVALSFNPALALGQITGTPWGIQVMQGDEAILHIGSRAHLGGAAEQDTHLPAADFCEKLFLFHFGICLVDEGNLFRLHPARNQLLADVLIDCEVRCCFFERYHAFQRMDLRVIQGTARGLCFLRFRRGE